MSDNTMFTIPLTKVVEEFELDDDDDDFDLDLDNEPINEEEPEIEEDDTLKELYDLEKLIISHKVDLLYLQIFFLSVFRFLQQFLYHQLIRILHYYIDLVPFSYI